MPCDDDNVAIFPFDVDIFFYCYCTVTFLMISIIHVITCSLQHVIGIRFHVRNLKDLIKKNHVRLLWQLRQVYELLYVTLNVRLVFVLGK